MTLRMPYLPFLYFGSDYLTLCKSLIYLPVLVVMQLRLLTLLLLLLYLEVPLVKVCLLTRSLLKTIPIHIRPYQGRLQPDFFLYLFDLFKVG